jgi:hypothetical protein
VALTAKRDGDRFTGIGLAPDFVFDALLKHHVIAEHVVERHIGQRGLACQARDREETNASK